MDLFCWWLLDKWKWSPDVEDLRQIFFSYLGHWKGFWKVEVDKALHRRLDEGVDDVTCSCKPHFTYIVSSKVLFGKVKLHTVFNFWMEWCPSVLLNWALLCSREVFLQRSGGFKPSHQHTRTHNKAKKCYLEDLLLIVAVLQVDILVLIRSIEPQLIFWVMV